MQLSRRAFVKSYHSVGHRESSFVDKEVRGRFEAPQDFDRKVTRSAYAGCSLWPARYQSVVQANILR